MVGDLQRGLAILVSQHGAWTGAAQVCLTRMKKGDGTISAAERIPDRCFALTPQGKIVRV